MLSTLQSYRMLTRDLDRTLSQKSEEKPVALESQYYLDHIGDVNSIDDFLKDTRLFTFAMKAFGLEDMAYAKAFMRKVLTEGVADSKSFANRLDDDRFINFAKTFDFKGLGSAATGRVAAKQGVVDLYVRQAVEVSAGEDNEGVRLALYFQREAPNIKSAYGLLADSALWQVVQTAYGFPSEMASADIDKQAAAIEKRLNIADLQDPAKLDKIIAKFSVGWDASENATPDPILALFDSTSDSTSQSIDLDLAMTLSSLRHGG